MSFEFLSHSEADTERFGTALARQLPPGTTVALCGTLGAGKTRLVQAVALALDIPPGVVVSPTFVLRQEYAGRSRVFHFDAYRVKDEDEFRELGAEECFEAPALTFIEWADRIERALPHSYLRIDIEVLGETDRRFTLSAVGPNYAELVARFEVR